MPKMHGKTCNGMYVLARIVVNRLCRLFHRAPNGAISIAKWRHYGADEDAPLVYDLTVESHACYQANGVLVSNSDALRYMCASIEQMTNDEKDKPLPIPRTGIV